MLTKFQRLPSNSVDFANQMAKKDHYGPMGMACFLVLNSLKANGKLLSSLDVRILGSTAIAVSASPISGSRNMEKEIPNSLNRRQSCSSELRSSVLRKPMYCEFSYQFWYTSPCSLINTVRAWAACTACAPALKSLLETR